MAKLKEEPASPFLSTFQLPYRKLCTLNVHMCYSLNCLKGGYIGDYIAIGVIKGDTRSLDYGSYAERSKPVRLQPLESNQQASCRLQILPPWLLGYCILGLRVWEYSWGF